MSESTGSDPEGRADWEAELDRLDAESRRREAELRELAAALPAAVSRTALVRSMIADLGGRRRRIRRSS